MDLHFKKECIEKLLEHLDKSTEFHPDFEQNAEGIKPGPGLWIVGDQGVYLMSNGNAKWDGERVVCYAEQCNPDKLKFDEWWENKNRSFGPDDGSEYIPVSDIKALLPKCKQMMIVTMSEDEFMIKADR